MGSYGIRVSAAGQDVKTCDDLDTIVNSKYALMKGVLSGSGSITNDGDEIKTDTIDHNLGYVPFAQVYIKFSDEDFWQEVPVFRSGIFSGIFVSSYCTTSQLGIHTEQYSEVSRTFAYKYFIYLDKGKLT